MKATYGIVNGKGRNIFKSPKTDDGGKKSAKGLLMVNKDGSVIQEVSWEDFNSVKNELKTVFLDGKLLVDHSLQEIRSRV